MSLFLFLFVRRYKTLKACHVARSRNGGQSLAAYKQGDNPSTSGSRNRTLYLGQTTALKKNTILQQYFISSTALLQRDFCPTSGILPPYNRRGN